MNRHWSPSQHKKYSATMAAKRAAREGARAPGTSIIPLDAIPERSIVVRKRKGRTIDVGTTRERLASDFINAVRAILGGRS